MAENPTNEIPGVPPPPAEVKIRTMKSDVASMQQSGGGLPQFRNVTVAGLSMERAAPAAVAAPEAAEEMARAQASVGLPKAPSAAAQEDPAPESSGPSHNAVGITLVVIVAFLAIAAVWYFASVYLGK